MEEGDQYGAGSPMQQGDSACPRGGGARLVNGRGHSFVTALLRAGVVCLVAGASCETRESEPSILVDTLPNGAVRTINAGAGTWVADGEWTLSPVVTIGADPADTVAQFGQIWDFTADESGRIYVLDRQAESVLVFGQDGRFIRRVGRAGQGPGELQFPTGLAWDPQGRLWVANAGNARFEVYDSAGVHVSSHPRRAVGFGYPWGGAFLRSGGLAEPSTVRRPGESGSRRVVLVQHDPASPGTAIDTVSLPPFERATWTVQRDRGRLVTGIPFTPELRWQIDPAGRLWVAANDQYRLHQVEWNGDTTRVVGRSVQPLAVQQSEVDAQLALFERTLPEFRTRVDLGLIPEHKPAFDVFFFDDAGYLWVAGTRLGDVYPGGFTNTFDIFDLEGRLLGSVGAEVSTVPPPKVVGDFLIGVSRDAFETQRLVVYRIEGRRAGDGSD